MANIEKEISDRLENNEWDKLIAKKVLSTRAKRKSEITNLILSIVAFCLITTSYFFASKLDNKANQQTLLSSNLSTRMK